MKRRAFINVLSGAIVCPLTEIAADTPSTGADPPEPVASERVAMAEAARAFMQKYDVPGLSVAIGHLGRLLYQDAFGWADREAGETATPTHLFRVCSISKPITSVAIFTLVEQGRLRLGDKVFGEGAVLGTDYRQSYRPSYPPGVDEITIEHLLHHTSGGWPNDGYDPMFHSKRSNHAELIAAAVYEWLKNPPGEVFAYSNFGYCVLGRVIEKVAGKPYADFVHESVLGRCGVSRMTISGNTLGERRTGEVKYYGQNGEDAYRLNVTRMDSCGGWIASPRDLVQFAMHVSGFPRPANILRSETIAMMTTASAQNTSYAKGWGVNEANTWWHTGSLPGSAAIMVRTNSGFCWAATMNSRVEVARRSVMLGDLGRFLRTMVGQVGAWRA
jgi:CubicO group peptidase (beta-lactamase class C family)